MPVNSVNQMHYCIIILARMKSDITIVSTERKKKLISKPLIAVLNYFWLKKKT